MFFQMEWSSAIATRLSSSKYRFYPAIHDISRCSSQRRFALQKWQVLTISKKRDFAHYWADRLRTRTNGMILKDSKFSSNLWLCSKSAFSWERFDWKYRLVETVEVCETFFQFRSDPLARLSWFIFFLGTNLQENRICVCNVRIIEWILSDRRFWGS